MQYKKKETWKYTFKSFKSSRTSFPWMPFQKHSSSALSIHSVFDPFPLHIRLLFLYVVASFLSCGTSVWLLSPARVIGLTCTECISPLFFLYNSVSSPFLLPKIGVSQNSWDSSFSGIFFSKMRSYNIWRHFVHIITVTTMLIGVVMETL